MSLRNLFTAALVILGTFADAVGADPTVSNLIAAIRSETKLIDIYHDVTAATLELI